MIEKTLVKPGVSRQFQPRSLGLDSLFYDIYYILLYIYYIYILYIVLHILYIYSFSEQEKNLSYHIGMVERAR